MIIRKFMEEKMINPKGIFHKPMLQEEYDKWHSYSDGRYRQKQISTWIIELYYGTQRGGMINLWEKGRSSLPHVWTPSNDNLYKKFDEIHFMDNENAIYEYDKLKSVSGIINLAKRNM